MEELIKAINSVAEACGEALPRWASIAGIVAPIILTVITIYLSLRMDRQNKKLQKMLSDRDTINQTRECILNIYNSFYTGLDIVLKAGSDVGEVFTSDQSYYLWAQSIENANADIFRSFNQAKLMVDDDDLINQLREAKDIFSRLHVAVNHYISTGIPAQMINNAWMKISSQGNIQPGNYYALLQNRVLHEEFLSSCKTGYTHNIQGILEEYRNCVGKDTFDKPFRKYVQIKELD